MSSRVLVSALCCAVSSACASAQKPFTDPKQGEMLIQSRGAWNSTLVWQGEVGVWCVKTMTVFPQYGCPEVVGLDDKGRLIVFTSYSGKWTPNETVKDGTWLGGIAQVDLDPRVEGPELYTGGNGGNFYRVIARPEPRGASRLESLEIGHVAADDVHTMIGGDLLPSRAGHELLAFTGSGMAYEVKLGKDADAHAAKYSIALAEKLPGRVRDAVTLPARAGEAPWIACVCRSQELLLLRMREQGLEFQILSREGMGLGRIALAPRDPAMPGAPIVFYATRDDGVILRWEGTPGGTWKREVIYAGPQGPRGIAAGRFDADPGVETVAIFGYSQRVELLRREASQPWTAETIYVDGDQGHWLHAAEVDGRNATDELLASGFGGRIVLISRKPGYGLQDVPFVKSLKPGVEEAEAAPAGRDTASAIRSPGDAPRIAAKANSVASEKLSPLCYQGGFETKSLVYETLVQRDAAGRIAPLLAASWTIEDQGQRFVFTLRERATFHDGKPVTAEEVRIHFKRWVGLPEHGWLRCNERITGVRALDDRRVEVQLDQPYALLDDLCAINPCAIRGPGSLDREGEHVRAIGSGPYRFAGVIENGRVLRYERYAAHPDAGSLPPAVELVRLEKEASDDPIEALLRGEVDVVLSSWLVRVDPARVRALEQDARFAVSTGPGSCVISIAFDTQRGPCADLELRRRIAAAIDREALVRDVEHGLADATSTWAAPSMAVWPKGAASNAAPAAAKAPAKLERPLRLAPGRAGYVSTALVTEIAEQLARAGIPTELMPADAPRDAPADLRLDITHGAPYDPWTTLVSRFGPRERSITAEATPRRNGTPRLEEIVVKAMAAADENERLAIYADIQAELDAAMLCVPLYAPKRVAIVRAGLPLPHLTHDMYGIDLRFLGQSGSTR